MNGNFWLFEKQSTMIRRAGIFSTYANFFLSFIRRETSKKHGFTLLWWLVFELSDAISEHFIYLFIYLNIRPL
jgi:hypothetical protein